jgi:hypothetical protein
MFSSPTVNFTFLFNNKFLKTEWKVCCKGKKQKAYPSTLKMEAVRSSDIRQLLPEYTESHLRKWYSSKLLALRFTNSNKRTALVPSNSVSKIPETSRQWLWIMQQWTRTVTVIFWIQLSTGYLKNVQLLLERNNRWIVTVITQNSGLHVYIKYI